MKFQPGEHVKVIAADGQVGRVEKWTQATEQYLVKFDSDYGMRRWFYADELECVAPMQDG